MLTLYVGGTIAKSLQVPLMDVLIPARMYVNDCGIEFTPWTIDQLAEGVSNHPGGRLSLCLKGGCPRESGLISWLLDNKVPFVLVKTKTDTRDGLRLAEKIETRKTLSFRLDDDGGLPAFVIA
jgi:hypothetical protein